MKISSSSVIALNNFIDIYKIGKDILEFYYIPTRIRLSIEVSENVIRFIHELDGKTCLYDICRKIEITSLDEPIRFCEYLVGKKIAHVVNPNIRNDDIDINRYSRQLDYFEAKYSIPAADVQKNINNTNCTIFGIGAIGGNIAIQLAMAGVENFVLIDKGITRPDSLERHWQFKHEDIAAPKVACLAKRLHEINSKIQVNTYQDTINYDTQLSKYLDNATFVVNSMDEPYIGLTSIKIGRECFKRKLPLYVTGGFDAHLMSTGELIIPNVTPCVDCYSSFFTERLQNWKPRYNREAISDHCMLNHNFEVGGLASQALFSCSYACISILDYIATGQVGANYGRGELMFNGISIKYIPVAKNPKCHVCGNR